jgi:hypothetical protein
MMCSGWFSDGAEPRMKIEFSRRHVEVTLSVNSIGWALNTLGLAELMWSSISVAHSVHDSS